MLLAEAILTVRWKVERDKVFLNFAVENRFENLDQGNGAIVGGMEVVIHFRHRLDQMKLPAREKDVR